MVKGEQVESRENRAVGVGKGRMEKGKRKGQYGTGPGLDANRVTYRVACMQLQIKRTKQKKTLLEKVVIDLDRWYVFVHNSAYGG